jgi:hypothetical protein
VPNRPGTRASRAPQSISLRRRIRSAAAADEGAAPHAQRASSALQTVTPGLFACYAFQACLAVAETAGTADVIGDRAAYFQYRRRSTGSRSIRRSGAPPAPLRPPSIATAADAGVEAQQHPCHTFGADSTMLWRFPRALAWPSNPGVAHPYASAHVQPCGHACLDGDSRCTHGKEHRNFGAKSLRSSYVWRMRAYCAASGGLVRTMQSCQRFHNGYLV